MEWWWVAGGVAGVFYAIRFLWLLERIAIATEKTAVIPSPPSMFKPFIANAMNNSGTYPHTCNHVHQQQPVAAPQYQAPYAASREAK